VTAAATGKAHAAAPIRNVEKTQEQECEVRPDVTALEMDLRRQ
jgi:hypothetical protein